MRELLEGRFGVRLRRLPDQNDLKLKDKGCKSADYELLEKGARQAVIEVKTLTRTPRTAENGWDVEVLWEQEGAMSWRANRRDNGPSRVAGAIRSGAAQLRRYEDPRILVILAEETGVDAGDLDEAFQGFMDYEGAGSVVLRNVVSRRIAAGIRDDRWVVDLFIWLEKPRGFRLILPAGRTPFCEDRTAPAVQFRCTSERGYRLATKLFGQSGRASASRGAQVLQRGQLGAAAKVEDV